MGVSTITGVGVPLSPPQALYPVTVGNFNPQAVGNNRISLVPGGDMVIPSGTWSIFTGPLTMLQTLDPVSQMWVSVAPYDVNYAVQVNSDGTNFRICNVSGFPIAAVVNNGGSGYTSAPTVTAGTGGSTWVAIVGGAISQLNVATAGSGAGYAVPPNIHISAPPAPGIQATAVCSISGGALATFTVINPGAGYTSAPSVTIVPQNSDLNLLSTSTVGQTNATVTAQLSFVGQVTGVLLVNEGNNPLSVPPALTFAGGGGSGALATAIMALTITAVTVTVGGSGYPAATQITSIGGSITSQTSGAGAANISSPALSTDMLRLPRPFIATAVQGSGGGVQTGTTLDSGLFTAPPTLIAVPGPATGVLPAFATFGVTMGGLNDTSFITPI